MRAMVIDAFGGPEQIYEADVPAPLPLENELLIEIAYTSVNPVDWKIREGFLQNHLPHRFPLILGWDAAGTVKSLGRAVTPFREGDAVYAYCRKPTVQWGTYAEYITVEASAVAKAPKNISLAQSASLPLVGLTAWQALFDSAKLLRGESLLISGGAGGVGGIAIQLAKHAGAGPILSTASSKNRGYLRELGVDIAIDYHTQNVGELVHQLFPKGLDVVFDTVGGAFLKEAYDLLRPGGRLVSIVEAPDTNLAKEKKIETSYVFVSPNGAQLEELAELVELEKVRPLPVEEMPLSDAAAALEKNRTRHVRGKIVLRVK